MVLSSPRDHRCTPLSTPHPFLPVRAFVIHRVAGNNIVVFASVGPNREAHRRSGESFSTPSCPLRLHHPTEYSGEVNFFRASPRENGPFFPSFGEPPLSPFLSSPSSIIVVIVSATFLVTRQSRRVIHRALLMSISLSPRAPLVHLHLRPPRAQRQQPLASVPPQASSRGCSAPIRVDPELVAPLLCQITILAMLVRAQELR